MPTIQAIPYKGNYILAGSTFPANQTIQILSTANTSNDQQVFSLTSLSDGSLPTNYYLLGSKGLFSTLTQSDSLTNTSIYIYARTPQGVVTNEIYIDPVAGVCTNTTIVPGIVQIPAMNKTTSNAVVSKITPIKPENVLPTLVTSNPITQFNVVGGFMDNVVASSTQGINPQTFTSINTKPRVQPVSQSANTALVQLNPN